MSFRLYGPSRNPLFLVDSRLRGDLREVVSVVPAQAGIHSLNFFRGSACRSPKHGRFTGGVTASGVRLGFRGVHRIQPAPVKTEAGIHESKRLWALQHKTFSVRRVTARS